MRKDPASWTIFSRDATGIDPSSLPVMTGIFALGRESSLEACCGREDCIGIFWWLGHIGVGFLAQGEVLR